MTNSVYNVESAVYVYDGFNQLTGYNKGNTAVTYKYNGDGIRTSKTVNGDTSNFLIDKSDVLAVVYGGNITESYLRGINLIAAQHSDGTRAYYLSNRHGDISGETDEDGLLIKSYQYDAFGVEQDVEASDSNPFRYTSAYYDSETGSTYLNARYLDSGLGRFTTEDSYLGNASDPETLNLYSYCANDPVNYIDPTGYARNSLSLNVYDELFDFLDAASVTGLVAGITQSLLGELWYLPVQAQANVMLQRAQASADDFAARWAGMEAEASTKGLSGNALSELGGTPAKRASTKGFGGIGTTKNGGPDFSGTDYLYPVKDGQKNIVPIELTGNRPSDYKAANEAAGFVGAGKKPPLAGYVWHHVDDYNPITNSGTMQLIQKDAHVATYPHAGSCAQYNKYYGVTSYK